LQTFVGARCLYVQSGPRTETSSGLPWRWDS